MRSKDPAIRSAIETRTRELVAASGIDGFSMHKLSKAVGISPATLYVHFQDREDLLVKVYRSALEELTSALLADFSPDLPFADGLRLQWRNRLRLALEDPIASDFLDAMRHSPYHAVAAEEANGIPQAMRAFVRGAMERGEIARLPVEVFWSIAFAPLYQLIRFHRSGFCLPGHRASAVFQLDDATVDLAISHVLKALTSANRTSTETRTTS